MLSSRTCGKSCQKQQSMKSIWNLCCHDVAAQSAQLPPCTFPMGTQWSTGRRGLKHARSGFCVAYTSLKYFFSPSLSNTNAERAKEDLCQHTVESHGGFAIAAGPDHTGMLANCCCTSLEGRGGATRDFSRSSATAAGLKSELRKKPVKVRTSSSESLHPDSWKGALPAFSLASASRLCSKAR